MMILFMKSYGVTYFKIKKMKNTEEKKKQFLGKLGNTINNSKTGFLGDFIDKIERNFQKKHLKAYLRGDEYFSFGKNQKTGEPEWYKVLYTFDKI